MNQKKSFATGGHHAPTVPHPGRPRSSGYAEPKPGETAARNKPNPVVAGDEASQIAPPRPERDIETPTPADAEPTPDGGGEPGENIEYPSDAPPLDGLRSRNSGGADKPDKNEEDPDDIDPLPPGEKKHEPIKDPDPADTKLRV